MSQVENAKPKWQKNEKYMLVKYGRIGLMGWFEHHETHLPRLNKYVVIKTERGLELGEVIGLHSYRGGQFKSTPEQVESYYCDCGKDMPIGEGGSFVRFATHEDLHEQEHLERSSIEEAKVCQRMAQELGLNMTIIEAEHLFGGERIVFYFTSEGRVDFRELVKRLAKEYQTRIELRQIGSRDEAKLISDYETCGQQCCCSRYLKILEPVNMRMAKLQKATLDPSKISGHCGRLKCCLRYEDATYLELRKNLPQRNDYVQTPKGQGKVVDLQILTQLVVVQDALGDRQAWPVDEIRVMTAEEVREMVKAAEAAPAPEQSQRRQMPEKPWQRNRPRPAAQPVAQEPAEHFGEVEEAEAGEQMTAPEPVTKSEANVRQGQEIGGNGKKNNRNRRRRNKNKNRGPRNSQNNPNNSNGQNGLNPRNGQNREPRPEGNTGPSSSQ